MSKKVFSRVKFKSQWNNLYSSTKNKISKGASNIFKIISWPKGEKWRRKEEKK